MGTRRRHRLYCYCWLVLSTPGAVGGFLGMGCKPVSDSFDQHKIAQDRIVAATQTPLNRMPEYKYNNA